MPYLKFSGYSLNIEFNIPAYKNFIGSRIGILIINNFTGVMNA
jgi:hypothetical protein